MIMYYFIVNPNSRSGAGLDIWNRLRSILESRGISYTGYLTRYIGHAITLSRQISSSGSPDNPVRLITVGGDGTIHEVLTGITDFDNVIFGYIPTGSGNDFCRGMGLPRDPYDALNSILKEERILSMDVPVYTSGDSSCRFGISTGTGYDAAVCQEVLVAPAKRFFNRLHLGKLVYLAVALRQLIYRSPVTVTVEIDDQPPRTFSRAYFGAVMNLPYEGGGFRFCPKARPDDGLLDVIVIRNIPKLLLLFCLPTAFFGGHTRIPGVHIFQGRSIHIKTASPQPIHKDGESGGIRSEFSVTLEKKPLKIIMPVV